MVEHTSGELSSYRRGVKQSRRRKEMYDTLERPGPKGREICLIRVSEARKASCFIASFFTSFLFLFSLFECDENRQMGYSRDSEIHILFEVVNEHVLKLNLLEMEMRGRGTFGSLFASVNSTCIACRKRNLLDCSRETLISLRVVADYLCKQLLDVARTLDTKFGTVMYWALKIGIRAEPRHLRELRRSHVMFWERI